ncbi:malectin domain-containing carbohydrate-binding protein, partial [Limimaricola pyoseonensis]
MAVTNDFTASELDLNGKTNIGSPTALVWGPDGRLYVTEQDGDIKVLTVAFGDKDPNDADPTASFHVTDAEDVDLVKTIPNFNDDGTSLGSSKRQVTGIDVTQQYDANGDPVMLASGKPAVVMYVTSSDSRIGAGGGGNDAGLDTNSGMITKLVQQPDGSWEAIDLVRGLARSEENHATNGLEVIQEVVDGKLVSERLIVANGGNANTGAPSNNFAGQQEQPYSAAILEVDLTELAGMPVNTDAASGRKYVYDMPTLNDPIRAGETDAADPFGGNDGLNSAKLIADGPVQIYSAGYRNAYDVEVTEDGRVWTYDNGANNNWGGRPAGEDQDGDTNSTEAETGTPPGYIATNLYVEDNNEIFGNFDPQNWDQLHEVTRSDDLNGRSLSAGEGGASLYTWDHPDHGALQLVYGGHPNPTRAEGARAGILYTPQSGVGNAKLMVSNVDKNGTSDFLEVVDWLSAIGYSDAFINATVVAVDPGVRYADSFAAGFGGAGATGRPTSPGVYSLQEDPNGPIGLPADVEEIVHAVNAIEGDYREAGYTDGSVDTGKGSVNGLAEYTSDIFEGTGVSMKGALFAASLNQGQYYVIGRDGDGVVQTTTTSGRTIAADRVFVPSGGAPLGLASIGDDLVPHGGNEAFRGSVWGAIYKQNGPVIEVLQPGNPESNALLPVYAGQEPSDPTDHDLDGVDHLNDPFEFDADNGIALAAGERMEINFSQVDLAATPEFSGTIGDTGLMGAALDGVTPNRDAKSAADGFGPADQEDGLFDNAGNIIPGGNAPILQIKEVAAGSALNGANTLRDGLHTGVRIDEDVKRLVAEVEVFNWAVDQFDGQGRVTGLTFGDGTQSNFVRFVFGDVGAEGGTLGLEVGIETDDSYAVLATVDDQAFIDALLVGDGTLNQKKVTLQLEIADIGGAYDILARYKVDGQPGFTEVPLNASLPEGVLQQVLDGTHTISDGTGPTLTSGAAIGIVAEKGSATSFTAVDIDAIRVEAFGNEIAAGSAGEVQGAVGTDGTDTVIYDGTDTQLGALPADIENFDGSGSDADFTLTANAASNRIKVGSGSNTITTGEGNDVVSGSLDDLDGDTVTDFSRDDAILIEGFSSADIDSVSYAEGSAILTINDRTFTLDGEDFSGENFDATDGAAYFDFTDTADGLRITSRAPLSPVVAVDAGGFGNKVGTLRDTVLTFQGDEGGAVDGNGFTTPGSTKAYTNAAAQGHDFPDTDLDAILATERSNAGAFSYEIAVPDGTYLVDLIFAEIYFGFPGSNGPANGDGQRIFDVEIEGTEVITNLDIHAEAGGGGKQIVKSFEVEVTDGVLNIDMPAIGAGDGDVNQNKLSGLVVWSVGGSFVPVDATAPVIDSISLENPQSVTDGTRTATVVVTDETGFEAADFTGLTGAVLQFSGYQPASVADPVVTLSNDGKTATLAFEVTPQNDSWTNGTTGTISLLAGAFNDAAGNGTPAASGGFVVQSNLDALDRGLVVRAINIGTADQTPGDLDPDSISGVDDDDRYGGALTDTIIKDAFGNFVTFEADSDAYHSSPKPSQNANVDGQSGSSGSNAGGIDLDGSAYHTYRDSAAASWTSTFGGFANGTYVVELHFAELFATSALQRVGDFTVNGVVFGDDYDAFTAGGGVDRPSFIRKAVTVTDGTIQVLVDDASAGQPGYSAIVVYEAVEPGAVPSLSVEDVIVAEGGTATITVTRTGDLSETTSVDLALSLDGTADAADVGALSAGSVSFAPGEASKTVTLPIVDDAEEEPAETLSVILSNATGSAVIANGSATVTIAASDSGLQAPVGTTIFELDFEGPGGEAIAAGGFDGTLGNKPVDESKSEVENGRLVVQTDEGDINDGTTGGSLSDFTKTVDLSDPALNEIYLTTSFENPFTEALLTSQGVTDGVVPNFVQQGIVLGTGTQVAGEMVKLVWGGVAGGTGAQMWTKGNVVDQKVTIAAMLTGGNGLFDVARVEMSLVVDKAAGTIGQYVTLFDAAGAIIGGVRPVATAGFATAAPVPLPSEVLLNLTTADTPTHVGVTSSDNSQPAGSFTSFEASWDFLRLSSPQYVEGGDGPPSDAVNGVAVAADDFSDDRLAPTDIGTLAAGETVIVASQQGDDAPGGRDRDYFTFTVAEGQELTGIVLEGWETEETGTPQAFIGINDSATVPTDPVTFEGADQMLGGYIYNSGDVANGTTQDGNLIDELGQGSEQGVEFRDTDGDGLGDGFTAPLPAGTYTIWLNQGGALSTATLKLVTAPVATGDIVLSITDAAPVEEGEGATLSFGLAASDAFTGTMEVQFDTGGASFSQSVQFTDGAGVLIVPAPNDEINDGDTTVGVTLTGATSADTAIPIVVDTAADSASGTVTEDDPMDPELQKGDLVIAINAGTAGAIVNDAIEGIDFAADTGFSESQTYTDDNANDPNGDTAAFDGTIYETERYAKLLTYTLTTKGDGTPLVDGEQYVLELYFAELYQNAANKRKFDVTLNGTELLEDDLDIVAEVGFDDPATPEVEGIYKVQTLATVVDGAITIELNANAAVGGIDNAKINGLALFELPADPSAVSVSVADVTVSEEAGTADVVFSRAGNTDTDMTITFSTGAGTATAGEDYTAVTAQTITIPAGQTSVTAQITLTGDEADEGTETFTVSIDDAVAAGATVTIADAEATVTLTDDDGVDPADIDGDGILNIDDPFAYDGGNGAGKVLAEGVSFRQDFDTETSDPFSAEAGFSGIVVNPLFDPAGTSATDPYGDRTTEANVSVAGGALSVTSSNNDLFGTGNNEVQNAIKDNYQSAVDVTGVDSFTIEAKVANPFFGGPVPSSYASFGITFGAGGVDDYVKFVLGGFNSTPRVQLAQEDSLTGAKEENILTSSGSIDVTLAQDVVFSVAIDKVAATVQGVATFFAADGSEIGAIATSTRDIAPNGSLQAALDGNNPLTNGTGGLAYGISITDFGGAPGFTADWDYLVVQGPEPVNDAPTAVTLSPATLTLQEGTDTSAGSVKLADIAVVDDGIGSNELTLAGADAGLFVIVDGANGPELHLAQGAVLDFETAPQIDVTVNVDDAAVGATPDATAGFTLTVSDVNEAPTAVSLQNVIASIPENADTTAGTTFVADIVVTDDGQGTNALTLAGANADLFTIVDGTTGPELHLKAGAALDFETSPVLGVSVQVNDPDVGGDVDATSDPLALPVTDANDAPTIGGTIAGVTATTGEATSV